MVGNFRFPNSKETCISIQREDRVFDTYCYTPQKEMDATGEQADIPPDYGIRIISLVPNPVGKDQDVESVTLLLSGSLPIDLSQ